MWRQRVLAGLALVSLGLAACGVEDIVPGTETPSVRVEEQSSVPQTEVPFVTPDEACVPPEQIHFDTFRGGSIPFSEASVDDILRLRNAIPPLDNPIYGDVSEGDWLGDDGLVLGYADGDEAYAYPLNVLNFHEIVDEDINGQPVLISYCPLCRSGLVFSRVLDGETLTFGNTSALYESDLVMYDHQTGSFWHQVGGQAIVGALCERRLDVLPSLTTTWGNWKALYPDTLILSRNTGFNINYERDPFDSYAESVNSSRFAFPVSEKGRDPRLQPAEIVLGVELDDARRVYSLDQLGDAVVMDRLAGRDVVVFSSADGPAGAAFFPEADGRALTFEFRDGAFVDQETGSIWNLTGSAIEGSLEGVSLESVPVRQTYWFSLVATFPGIDVHTP